MFDVSSFLSNLVSMPLFDYVGVSFAFAMIFSLIVRWFFK